MSVLAAIFDWRTSAPPPEDVGALLSALADRSPDGRRFLRAPYALLGMGARVVRIGERPESQLLRDDRRRVYAVGDVRLDNREELKASLPGTPGPIHSDLALAVAAYQEWGPEGVKRFAGDFAFVIWDERKRQVYGARDHFGVRSLVYHRTAERLILATEPAQLLALDEFDRSVNSQAVVDLLAWSYAHYGRTFFRAVHMVRPGHYFCANATSLHEVDYFQPPDRLCELATREDYLEEFRRLFRLAVRDRLDSRFPIVAHLSGGLDSSSIVCMADAIHSGEAGHAPVAVVSALFPDQRHDERAFIDQITQSVRFDAYSWDGSQPSGREFSQPSLSIPGTSVMFNGGSTGDIDIAERLGARVVITGDSGDAVTGEHGLFSELLRQGRWLTLARQVWSGASARERDIRLGFLRQAVSAEAPAAAVRAWRMLRSRPRTAAAPPSWLRSEWLDHWRSVASRSPPFLGIGVNRLQQRIWDFLRWSRLGWCTDMFSSYASSAGLEARYPFLDIRLGQFVLSVPPEQRLFGALRRTLHRDAMTGIIPPGIARRESKAIFDGAITQWGHRSQSEIREILEDPQWRSEAFVDQAAAREEFHRLIRRPPSHVDWEEWLGIRSVVHVETWLRAIFRYPRMKETLPMSEIAPQGDAQDEQVQEVSPEAYVPPSLTPIGNVRDLLAGGSSPGPDSLGGGQGLA